LERELEKGVYHNMEIECVNRCGELTVEGSIYCECCKEMEEL